ncbi:hypothetical protein HDZ31DRAFT_37470 [Schizophyllum fasciatum]
MLSCPRDRPWLLTHLPVREDISAMFRRGEFILAPTFKTYIDIMRFVQKSGIRNRSNSDRTPRRPLTAGSYRYVFIPYTDAARALQDEFKMQPQTKEDLNHGVDPFGNSPADEACDQFPVVETFAHPFSVAIHAYRRLTKKCTHLTSQWLILVWKITTLWSAAAPPPQWFLDMRECAVYDEDLTASVATGYLPVTPECVKKPEPVSILQDTKLAEDNYRKKAAKWAVDVGPDADPPEDEPPRVVYAVRRSRRIQERAHPYRSPSPIRSAPLRSPTRNVARALLTCKRNPVQNPPSWASQNGRYPTHRFSSNDWAYFLYNVYLATPRTGPRYAPIRYWLTLASDLRTGSKGHRQVASSTFDSSQSLHTMAMLQMLTYFQLTPPGGMYRYVFIPCTDAARALQQKLKLQPQTAEDLDNGVCPVDNAPFREGSDQFPVVECHAHPYSVAMDAFEKMNAYSNMLISQWHVLAWRMASIWNAKMKPPQWFAESAVYTMYDEDLTPSEASGYIPIKPNGLPAPEPISVLRDLNLAEDSCRKKAARWTIDVGPDADPPEDDPRRVVYAVRRSRRIQERAHPYRSLPSPIRSGPLRSPTRNAARALLTCKRNPVKNPPSWVSQNGRYSSHRFSSNDWAYFRYNVYLATPVET